MHRPSGRRANELRSIDFTTNVNIHAEGSCLVKFGNTHVLCTASVEEKVPNWMRNSGKGWVTAEYGMLPRSTGSRIDREAARGRQSGRTQEIQRLIGRALRAIIDMEKLGERQIRIDCDVLQADGGTRTAAISGAFIAMSEAIARLEKAGLVTETPIRDSVAAISCGICEGTPVLDLDYAEDSTAETDANFVITGSGGLVEIQAAAEKEPFSEDLFNALLALARKGCNEIAKHQQTSLGTE
ncbi:MAG: ribonuclease PH [Alphaproteobacteria bacterium]|nr:ribonuclease PH [Alphaproteobacteria bacterium]